uniref:Innexin n=1 Tax=Romanomermis culicivorax TaxID=13658 RepID=A0A915IIM2_ROMCU
MIFLDQILGNLKKRSDTDFIDRLNYYYTPMLIVFFGLTLSAKQYVGQPIQCWVPAQFTGAWEQYSEYFCFVQNTYFVPFHEDLPTTYEERDRREIGYYQWVPFILALQAFLFFFPVMVWRLLNWQSGICVKTLVNAAVDVHNVEDDTCRKNTDLVARHMKSSLEIQHRLEPRGNLFSSLFYGKHYGCYVSTLYLFVKFLFIVNVVCQFFILNSFLGSRYTFWGFEILRDIWIGREWTESGMMLIYMYPRQMFCFCFPSSSLCLKFYLAKIGL